MKKKIMRLKKYTMLLLFIAFITSCLNTANAQDTPKAVKEAFAQKYPGEDDPDWEKDSHGNFEAHFKKNGEKYRADFAPNGQWIETENSVKWKDLPKAVQDAIERLYEDEDISELEFVDSATKGKFYDVEFKRKGKNKDVMFRTDGTRI